MSCYPKVRPLGHREVAGIDQGEVVIQEKVDGSNFSMVCLVGGVIKFFSHHQELLPGAADKMFKPAIEHLVSKAPSLGGMCYRFELLNRPKHNVLAYERMPKNGLVLFGMEDAHTQGPQGCRLLLEGVARELDVDVVPELYRGPMPSAEKLEALTKGQSFLGGPIEGVVIKNYGVRNEYGRHLVAKFVRPEFKETAQSTRKVRMGGEDIADMGVQFGGEARWLKAVQWLKETGNCSGGMEDVGFLFKRVQSDVESECEAELKEQLWRKYRKQILAGATRGLPEWYKQKVQSRED
jgi:hypothetical protein